MNIINIIRLRTNVLRKEVEMEKDEKLREWVFEQAERVKHNEMGGRPTVEEVIETAKKIEKYIREG